MSQKTDWVIQLYVWHCKLESSTLKEKATSNICTAQALLANISANYAVYHGPQGLKSIANRVYGFTTLLANEISKSINWSTTNGLIP